MDPRTDLREATERNSREAREEREAAGKAAAQAAREQADAAAKAQTEAAAAEPEVEGSLTSLRCSPFPSEPWPLTPHCPWRRKSSKTRR